MEKFWLYVAIWMIGFAGGLILGVIIDKDTVYKGVFRIKQKGRGNVQKPTLDLETKPLSRWRQRRIEKKKERALRRLEKIK